LEITRRTDYAIRILLALAGRPDGEPLSSRELGKLQDVPHAFARSIVTELVGAGFVTSRRGAGGGVALARPAAQITLLEVIRALEGGLSLNLCTHDDDYCRRAASCAMHEVWLEAEAVLSRHLSQQDFAALAARGAQLGRHRQEGGEAVA
jgi:Rrf2 family protein